MVNKKVMGKRENLVTYRILGAGMMPSYVEYLKADYVPPGNYPNAVVWKDLGQGSSLGDEIPMNGTSPKSNEKVRIPSTVRCLRQLVSLMSDKSKSVYMRLEHKRKDSSDSLLHLYPFYGNLICLYLKPANVKVHTTPSLGHVIFTS